MKRTWILAGVVVILAVFAWLLFGGLQKNVVFFLTPQELLAKGNEGVGVPEMWGRAPRLGGSATEMCPVRRGEAQ